MRVSKTKMRALIGALLVLIVAATPSLRSLAQGGGEPLGNSDGDDQRKHSGKDSRIPVTEAITAGVVTTSGSVKVNDNVVQTGTTVLSGSIIVTGGDGQASVDMGRQGVLEMRPNTKLWLNTPGGPIKVDLRECGSITESVPAGVAALVAVDKQSNIRVTVIKGKVKVTRDGKDVVMKEKEERTYDKVWLVTGVDDSVFRLDCDNVAAGFYFPGPMSLIGLIAAAGGITGSTVGKPTPAPSPPVPSGEFP
jgi:hypothetical protein